MKSEIGFEVVYILDTSVKRLIYKISGVGEREGEVFYSNPTAPAPSIFFFYTYEGFQFLFEK